MTLFPKTIPVSTQPGGYVNGEWVIGTPVVGTFVGSVQPMTDKEIQALPVARKDVGYVKIYSNTPLNVSTEGGAQVGDVVTWQGSKWEVVSAGEYQNGLINHYKYVGMYTGEA